MRKIPNLNLLYTFACVSKLMSFKDAAKELHITQTAVSHQIKKLEETIGYRLFVRMTRQVSLTEKGAKLAINVQKLFDELSATLEELSQPNNRLFITTTTAFASMWLVPKLPEFQKLYPEISISISTTDERLDLNTRDSLDLAIRYGFYDKNACEESLLVTEKMGLYASLSYLSNLSHEREVKILSTSWKNKSLPMLDYTACLINSDYQVLDIEEYDQENHVIQAALSGSGVAFVSELLVQTQLNNNWLVRLPSTGTMEGLSYYMASRKNLSPNHQQQLDTFTCWLRKQMCIDS